MSINMADVKQIINNANNKEIVKIQDSLGNILWQKQVTPTLTYYINMFTIKMTVSSKLGFLDKNMFNGSGGTVVDSVTGIDQYFCLLTQSEFEGFNNNTLADGTTIGLDYPTTTSFPSNPNLNRLCYYDITDSKLHIVGGGTTYANDTIVSSSLNWSTTEAQFYANARGNNTSTSSRMYQSILRGTSTVSLRINAAKKAVYHTNSDATGYTNANSTTQSFTRV